MSRTRAILVTVLLGLAAGTLTAALLFALPGLDPNQAGRGQITTGRALVGGPFELTDQSGRRVTEKDFAGRPMLVYFGFTHCPDVCPAGLQIIAAALDKLGDRAKEVVTPIFVTVDPERDTEALLGKYVASFHPNIIGLTGSVEDIKRMTKTYRVYAKKTKPDEHGSYSVDHSSFMYLMDSKGLFIKHFRHNIDPEKLAEELRAAGA